MMHRIDRAPVWQALATAAAVALLAGALSNGPVQADAGGRAMRVGHQGIAAPEFPPGMTWLNTEEPLRLADLRGKVVLLDFWTYCCINCMHVLPELARLEAKYPDEVVVIGVHSAKFDTEKDTDNIRQAIQRYRIRHPVVNDHELAIWNQYGVRAWPTLVLIDPSGKIAGYSTGETRFDALDRAVADLIAASKKKGLHLNPGVAELGLRPEIDEAVDTPLSFPGKVLADGDSKRLFVADSNHHRIVIVSLEDDSLVDIVGSGQKGLGGGPFDVATFNQPQGLALDGDILYVADTGNHALRKVDLKKKRVTTLAGTGTQAGVFALPDARKVPQLNSPWDVLVRDGTLYIAMAGPHQIWRMDLETGEIGPWAGSGVEARIDGPAAQAALAQPSGLATDGKKLYFADSEASAVRSVTLAPPERVDTIVGLDLFDFGDEDGATHRARLQHPMGVAHHDGALYVADTYNNKIRRIDLDKDTCTTFLGTGTPGREDGRPAQFDEPAGVSVAGDTLYIADTNNHLIRAADLATGQTRTITIEDLARPVEERQPVQKSVIVLAPGKGVVKVRLGLPQGHKLTEGPPTSVTVRSSNRKVISFDGSYMQVMRFPPFPASVGFDAHPGAATITVKYEIYYCETGGRGVCLLKNAQRTVPVQVVEGGEQREVVVSLKITKP